MCDKIIYGLLTILILSAFGCSDKQHTNNKAFTFDNQINETIGLIGEWTLSSTISRTDDSESSALCNACPTINFGTNTAILSFPNNRTENYNWRISSDTLTLLSTKSPTSSTMPYFLDFKYKMEFKQEKEFLELKLSPNKTVTYVLRR